MLKFALPFIAFALFDIAAFGSVPAQAADRLAGSEWGLEGEDLPFIRFGSDGRISGNSGCNRFTGGYEAAEDGSIKIGPLAATRMACPEPAMSAESKFLSALDATRRYQRDGIRLSLRGEDGGVLMELAQRDAD